MYCFEHTVNGSVNLKKLWEYYSNVSNWKIWDDSVQDVEIQGNFEKGSIGVMQLKNAQSLPFEIDTVSTEKEFTTVSRLGSIIVTFFHVATETSITHKITISGGDENQMADMGKGITMGIPACMEKLLSLVTV